MLARYAESLEGANCRPHPIDRFELLSLTQKERRRLGPGIGTSSPDRAEPGSYGRFR